MQAKGGGNISQFEILNRLGEGAFGQVYKIKRKDNQKFYAMKKIKMMKLSNKEKENALNEIRILASLSSPYIIKYKDAFYNDPSSELCIVMEFADKGDLQGLIQQCKTQKTTIDEQQIWTYAAQILMALKSLHDLNILHRDLKGANVFLSENGNSIKLGDLNVSKVTKSNLAYTQTGTPYYLAPEVWKGEPYNSKCDIWSLGCVIYECCNLAPPFQGTSLEDLYKKVLKGNYNKLSTKYSTDLAKFIANCLILSPSGRPSVKDLLEHPKIKPNVQIDPQAQKAQLLKTMKLPYGGLHQLQNILPKAKYDEENKLETIEEQKPQGTQQNMNQRQSQQQVQQPQQQPQQSYQQQPQQRQERAQSASRARQESPSSYQYYQRNQQPINRNIDQSQNKQQPNQQQQSQQQQQNSQQKQSQVQNNPSNQSNQKQSLVQYQQNQQVNPPVISKSQRSSSSDRLMKNYENNNYYNQNFGAYQYGNRQNTPQNSNIPRPPVQGQFGQKPPMQKPPAGQPSQYRR